MNAPVTPRERPILFSGEMVRQVLADKKTQTRRPIGLSELRPSTTPGYDWTWRGTASVRSIAQQRRYPDGCWQDVSGERLLSLCPYGEPGHRLWVRETWRPEELSIGLDGIRFRADNAFVPILNTPEAAERWLAAHGGIDVPNPGRWRPSIHMPRWASRLTLDVLSVRVERLHDISDADILAEGVTVPIVSKMTGIEWAEIPDLYTAWRLGWTHIYGAESWGANPWIWVVEFRRVEVSR